MEANSSDPVPISNDKAAKGKANLSWALKQITKSKKTKGFSVPCAKRAIQLLAEQGKEPSAFKVAPDGSFWIELAQASKTATEPDENPWDQVL